MKFKNKTAREVLFPLGGIGSGCVSIAGNGVLRDFEIFNRPNKGSYNDMTHFAVRADNGRGAKCKVVCGDALKDFMGRYAKKNFDGYGFGVSRFEMNGFPHFEKCTAEARFPFCTFTFSDGDFPCKVKLTAWSPFIPLDDKNSSLPAAFFELELYNDSEEELEVSAAFTLGGAYEKGRNEIVSRGGNTYAKISAEGAETDPGYGDMCIACEGEAEGAACWYRGSWNDGAVVYWGEFEKGGLKNRTYPEPGKDNATLCRRSALAAGGRFVTKWVLCWNTPYAYNYWGGYPEGSEMLRPWKNYYATLFADSAATADYALEKYEDLKQRSAAFTDALFSATLPAYVIDAVSSNLADLKSPSIFRLEDGSFYGFEGSHETEGSCEGTCQHVWNYAYAMCFLFPSLERSIRELEFTYQTREDGFMAFRLQLPIGHNDFGWIPCADGQMGAVIKTYREWKISGDDAWLKRRFPDVKKVLEYAWSEQNFCKWDEGKTGVLHGRMHHTLDMELFGANGWLQSFYLAALRAAEEMAAYLGEEDKAAEYRALFEKGKKWSEENLFNGGYFVQKTDLKDKSVLEKFGVEKTYWNDEAGEMKYQIGEGCALDQLLGQWHADILGLGALYNEDMVKKAALSVYRHNFKTSQRDLANVWRVFAANDEAGAVICDYPKGTYRPVIPVPYTDEMMTGMEYAFAGLLIGEGFLEEGLRVVKAVRDRYTGEKRNPFSEIECGSSYARSMASFALLPLLSGFTFDMPRGVIGFDPKLKKKKFRAPWSLASGWGVFERRADRTKISLCAGELKIKEVRLPYLSRAESVKIDGKKAEFTFENGAVRFAERAVRGEIEIRHAPAKP